uniref:RNA polymerase sigma factor n=1 Tax=Pelargonium transvaalense TaxID=158603 RepID=A0A0G2STT3_9ROSI|nr:sigma factor [Pelargonium transvaalense]
MSCLLPQFKCQPDTFCIQFRTPLSKIRGPVYLRTRCVLSTISAPTSTATSTLLDMEKLHISSLEAHSNPVSAQSRWTHMEAIGPPTEASFQATLARETLVTSDEAIIAAAAAEVVSYAKAAIKVAEDAKAMTTNNFQNGEKESKPIILSEVKAMQSIWVQQCIESEEMSELGVSVGAESEMGEMEDLYLQYPTDESSCPEPTNEELTFLEQLSSAAAVRSTRQSERKARRARATEKAATNVVPVNSVSTRKKKTRKTSRKVNRGDPLWHLRSPKSKLLTAAEEKTLSEGIQDLLKLERLEEELTARCQGEPTSAQLADAAGVDQKTLQQRLYHGVQCKDKMVNSNIGLVISVARKYQGAGMEIQDLVTEGCLGLMKGVEKFDPSKGYKFSTYAHWWIRQAIRRALTVKSRLIRIPFNMVGSAYKVRQAKKNFLAEHGRDPTDEELAEASGLTMKKLRSVLMAPTRPISFERRTEFGGFGEGLKASDIFYDPDAVTPEEEAINQMLKEELEKVLNTLNARERQVIKWRYGLEDGRMKALQEIGELMSISRERVRQIEACAMRKLKGKKRMEHLRSYLVVEQEDTGTF